jgi:hypothetical protein
MAGKKRAVKALGVLGALRGVLHKEMRALEP